MTIAKRAASILLVVLLLGTLFGCSSKKAMEPFLGKWQVYQMGDAKGVHDFTTGIFAALELSVEFYEDGTYVEHYYALGKEGSAYPKYGTFSVEKDQLIMTGEDGTFTGEIIGDDLVITYQEDNVHYYKRID